MTMSASYGTAASVPAPAGGGNDHEIDVISLLVTPGCGFPPVSSDQSTVTGVGAAVTGTALEGAAQLPSYLRIEAFPKPS